MHIPFTKMHGLGNDFVIFDFTKNQVNLSAEQAAYIADRKRGIGCDQILIVESSQREQIDFKYRIFNADGSEVSQCGNGARCFARFVHDNSLTDKNPVRVETYSGDMALHLLEDQQVRVDMGEPIFAPEKIPFISTQESNSYTVNVANRSIELSAVSIGNPHAVIQVENCSTAPVEELGPAIESHKLFTERVNVGFMQIVSTNEINLRVYERGAGETTACGSGACAAVACGINNGLLDETVTVHLTGGDLEIAWKGVGHNLTMTGSTTNVYTGTIELAN